MFLHRTHIRVKTRKDNPSVSSILEHTGEDNIQELIHVEISGQVSIPGAILVANMQMDDRLHLPLISHIKQRIHTNANLHLRDPLQLNIKSYIFWNSLKNLKHVYSLMEKLSAQCIRGNRIKTKQHIIMIGDYLRK